MEPDSLPVMLLAALNHFQMRDFPQAIQLFNRTLELKPKFAQPHYYLGVMYAQTSNNEAAMEHFKKARELEPTNFSAAFGLGGRAWGVQFHFEVDADGVEAWLRVAEPTLSRVWKRTADEVFDVPVGVGRGCVPVLDRSES